MGTENKQTSVHPLYIFGICIYLGWLSAVASAYIGARILLDQEDLDEDEQSEYDEYKSWKKMNNSFKEEKRREESSTPLEPLASLRISDEMSNFSTFVTPQPNRKSHPGTIRLEANRRPGKNAFIPDVLKNVAKNDNLLREYV